MNRLNMQLLEKSLSPELNRKQAFNAGEGAGKSGSFFFFSHDRKYIIKTMSSSEIAVMLKILPNYIEHLRRTPNSLIAKIFGIFTIEKEGYGKVHVMLMENTLQFYEPDNIKCIFDLKGSKLARTTHGELKNTTIRKDNDYRVLKRRQPKMFQMASINRSLINGLIRDIHFFKTRGLLDYSLLFAVERTEE